MDSQNQALSFKYFKQLSIILPPYQSANNLLNICQSFFILDNYQHNKIIMFYVNTRSTVDKIKEKQLLDSLIIPPEQRTTKDHQTIYRYFYNNQMLIELERVKSLNARIKCIASLTMISAQDLLDDHIIMHQFQDNRMIVLSKSIKQQSQNFNQKIIRKKMDELGQFSLIKLLKYEELLYLAFHMEFAECKYKQYLYRQGEQPNFVFLISQGEFHYVKQCYESKQKSIMAHKNKKNKKRTSLKSDQDEEEDSPNKYVKTHISRYKVGIVSGNQGQAIGLQQIVLPDVNERKYSVLCNSTENRVIKINRKYLQVIFQSLPQFLHQLQKQVNEANQAKEDFFKKIKITKNNIKDSIIKDDAKGKAREKEQQQLIQEKSIKHINEDLVNRYQLPAIDKKDVSFQYRSRAFSSALTTSLQAEDQRLRSMKSQTSMYMEAHDQQQQQENIAGASFAITGIAEDYPIKLKLATKLLQSQTKQSLIDSKTTELPLFPLIGGKRSLASLDGQLINSKAISILSKSKSKSKLNQYRGLIDSSQLVRDMQTIMDKKKTRTNRKDLFPVGHIEYKSLRNTQIPDPMKLKASPAHSNRFMQKLLLKVLKKAGYDEEVTSPPSKPQNKTVNIKPIPYVDFHRSISRNHQKEKKEQIQNTLLIDSPFDDCYFAKI